MKEHVEYLNMSYIVGFRCARVTGHFCKNMSNISPCLIKLYFWKEHVEYFNI